ncbi:aminoacyl-tRNA deacylase [Cupriavidus agavae]|uniref:Ala-tRNA(Pro) deacylase n=1 Tax=Cupriavidus agavae TaxID=1001822 RepID=A0A4Q7RXF8_9BURK|nr:YbaK/EbsC family protein [Cupriavidus agavae]RZT36902.1 Ala-tRNA(Pro) deacylase [Cupriavidus agavae]
MAMAGKLARCLGRNESRYDIVRRPDGMTATASAPPVPRDRLARAVLLEDRRGYLVAVIPASHRLKLAELRAQTGRELTLAHGDGVREVFRDCRADALPAVGMAYGTQTWLDDSLLGHPDVYFEAGDHEALVHMHVDEFAVLMADAPRGHFAHRVM